MKHPFQIRRMAVEVVRQLLVNHFFIKPTFFRLNKNLRKDFGFSSLEITELVVLIEQQLGINLPDETPGEVRHVKDLVAYTQYSIVAA